MGGGQARGGGGGGVIYVGAGPRFPVDFGTLLVVVVVFTLKTVLTSIQYPALSYSSRQRNELPRSQANPK